MTAPANVQAAINSRELPFPVRATEGEGLIKLTIQLKLADQKLAVSECFRVPADLVILPGFSAAMTKITAKAYQARHMGIEVI
jgi:hypothetical protein